MPTTHDNDVHGKRFLNGTFSKLSLIYERNITHFSKCNNVPTILDKRAAPEQVQLGFLCLFLAFVLTEHMC
jgi:hypothetical protein